MRATILIPAYNEEKGIKKTIDSCLNQTINPDEIIVVNDGSTDNTLNILKSFKDKIKIINLEKNTGNKSKAQEIGLKHIKTEIFITADADTELEKNFVKEVKEILEDKTISAVCGFVKSEKNNWITAVRDINYVIGQTIYKKAQSYINAVFVLAGCSSAFRTKDFKEVVTFEHDNITEDLDFTYKLKLANKKIVFSEKPIVYTQDPNTLKSYFKQIYRWYSGGWTCLKKNRKILKQPNNALILSLIYLEGLIMGLAFILSPLLLIFGLNYFLYFFILEFVLTTMSLSYGAIKYKQYNLFLYIPHHYLLHIADDVIFLFTFVKEIIFNKRNLTWQKPERY